MRKLIKGKIYDYIEVVSNIYNTTTDSSQSF